MFICPLLRALIAAAAPSGNRGSGYNTVDETKIKEKKRKKKENKEKKKKNKECNNVTE